MASIQARHSRRCAIGRSWTPADKMEACDCRATFYVVVRDGLKAHRERVGKNRRDAERALPKVQTQEDDGSYRPIQNKRVSAFADEWPKMLARKETTKDSYRSTMAYAKEAFGPRNLRQVGPTEIASFNALLIEKKLSASTRAKHLRVLHAFFSSAMSHGHTARNPVNDLPDGEKPQVERKESAYFIDDEIPRLFANVPEEVAGIPNVYRVLFLAALKTGMRQGELMALKWENVDLAEELIHVRWSYTDGHLSRPKNHEVRDVHITTDVVEMLGAWWGRCGKPEDSALVFPNVGGGYLSNTTILRRELYPAMVRADVPREGPTGEKRTFHSLRHTFAKLALENGRQVTWLSRHLGHSSLKVTTDIYGHWEAAKRKKEAQKMKGVFGI